MRSTCVCRTSYVCGISLEDSCYIVGESKDLSHVHYTWIVDLHDVCYERFGPPVVMSQSLSMYSNATTTIRKRKLPTGEAMDSVRYSQFVRKSCTHVYPFSIACIYVMLSIVCSLAAVPACKHPYVTDAPPLLTQSITNGSVTGVPTQPQTKPASDCNVHVLNVCEHDMAVPAPTGVYTPPAVDVVPIIIDAPDQAQPTTAIGRGACSKNMSVLLWNVCGLEGRLQDSEFITVLSNAGVFALTETRMTDTQVFINGYTCIHAPHITPIARRTTARTGGVLVGVRNDLMHAVMDFKVVNSVGSLVYLRIDGKKLGLCSVLHFVSVYMPHRQSTYFDEYRDWDVVQQFVAALPQDECVYLIGDMNARTGIEVPEFSSNGRPVMIGRSSADSEVNDSGKRLVRMCSDTSMLPLNGLRLVNDTHFDEHAFADSYTYYTRKRGIVASVIDYICTNLVGLELVCDVKQEDRRGHSDHFPLVCRLGNIPVDPEDDEEIATKIGRQWCSKGVAFDASAVESRLLQCDRLRSVLDSIESLMQMNPSDASLCGDLSTHLNDLFDEYMESVRVSVVGQGSARRNGRDTRGEIPIRIKRKRRRDTCAWYDSECREYAHAMHGSIKCCDRNGQRKAHNAYRNVCRRKRGEWLEGRLHEIESVLHRDKSTLWRTIDRLIGYNKSTVPPVSKERLRAHYCKAFNVDADAAEVLEPPAQPSIPSGPFDPASPYVTKEEIAVILKRLQRGKAAGIDGMPSDVLCDLRALPVFVDSLFLLINVMIHVGFWPNEWNKVLISPLLKHGKDPLQAESYRPIHLICVLAKVVSRVVERRILRTTGIPECQMAYINNHGTRDNIFIVNTIIDKYKSAGVYLVFVDFTAAFDTIDRKLLLEKLRAKEALDSKFMHFLSVMLTGVCASVKDTVLRWFNEGLGVKQGDPSGPRVFVTFIHDLPDHVCPEDPATRKFAVFLINQLIRCLLWADDLLLFSLSIEHTQRQIDALESYCIDNKLLVNRRKTQVVYVHTRGNVDIASQHVFTYGGTCLKNVASYQYLGVWLDNRGSCDVQAKDVLAKATKAQYMCMSKARGLSTRCPPLLRALLFKSYVIPHFTYVCEVIPYSRKHIGSMNVIINKYARWAVGLPAHSCTNSVLRELNMRPIQYDFLRARMNYYLLLMSRQDTHTTRIALADLCSRESTSVYSRWYRGIIRSFTLLACTYLLENPVVPTLSKRVVGRLVQSLWLREGGASVEDIQLETCSKYSRHLRDIRYDDPCLDTTRTVRMNVLAEPASRLSVHVQVVDMCKYAGTGNNHLSTTRIKRYEQEALSMFRTGVAPCFVWTGPGQVAFEHGTNRLKRTCIYCKHIHDVDYVSDVFHVLFMCPLVAEERVTMWNSLAHVCGCNEWVAADSVHTLALSLLCPQSVNVACTVGRFLSEYLAASELFAYAQTGASILTRKPKWLGGRRDALDKIINKILLTLQLRTLSSIPFPTCDTTHMWISYLTHESLHDAFKPIRTWLSDGWAMRMEPSSIRTTRSISLF